MESNKQGEIYECFHCGLCCKKKYNLLRHIEKIHLRSDSNRESSLHCGICQKTFLFNTHLQSHLKNEHPIEKSILKFASEEDFVKWKEAEEIRSKSFFAKRRTKKRNRMTIVDYICNRSGKSKNLNQGKRMSISKGYSKIGTRCPAQITTMIHENGMVKVTYYSTHMGHQHQLCYLHLPLSEEKIIADKIKSGVSLDSILDEVRNNGLSTSLKKKHLLTKKNLYNIMKKYNISQQGKYHQNDAVSVDNLLNECSNLEHNPIIMFKKQNETHQTLSIADFMMVVMTEMQIAILKECGSEKICIDSTHGTNESNFQLTTVMVIDEFGDGFPVSFCISNRIDEVTMTIFFQQMKNVIGSIKTSVFMSDDAPCFYKGWKNVMGDVECRLFCEWYVDRNWKKKLSLICDKQKKCEVYTYLRLLLEEPDTKQFSVLLSAFIQLLQDMKCDDFYDYFSRTYYNRVDLWAACFRTKEFLNTNAVLEALHRALKQVYSKSIKNQQLDALLNNLLKIIRDRSLKRLIHLEEGYANYFMNEINNRHRLSTKVTDISQVSEKQWKVTVKTTKNIFYTVESDVNSCNCRQKCLICNICVHMYSCTCVDYLVKHNMCKHIHAVRMFQRQDEKSNVEIDPFNDNICEVFDMDNDNNIKPSNKNMLKSKCQQLKEMLENVDDESIKEENEEKVIHYIDVLLNILCQSRNNDANKEPAKEKVQPQFRFSPTKKEIEENKDSLKKTPTVAQKNVFNEVLLYTNSEIINVFSDLDHCY